MKVFDYETYRKRLDKANKVVYETDRLVILGDGCRLRKTPPWQPTVNDLVRHGDIIELVDKNISPRRYIVKEKIKEVVLGVECWSFKMINVNRNERLLGRNAYAYAGDYVAQDGEILHLFERNPGRVIVLKRSERLNPVQMELF